jgi:hypothetical protein
MPNEEGWEGPTIDSASRGEIESMNEPAAQKKI